MDAATTSGAADGATGAVTGSPDRRARRSSRWAPAALVAWTAFVWIGRIRNAMADPALDGGGRTGPVLLASSFLVPAVVVAVLAWRDRGRPAGPGLRAAVAVLATWTTGVWVVRAADIALLGDHDAAFVAVHLVLAAASVGLAVAAARSVGLPRRRG